IPSRCCSGRVKRFRIASWDLLIRGRAFSFTSGPTWPSSSTGSTPTRAPAGKET
ncbi:unnamed protein product, partial [Effrenium voratum]